MTTTKKTTTKKSSTKKTTLKDTGAMDEFVNTMVGVTLKEEDIVEKKPKVKAKKINTVIDGTPKIGIETIPETETSAQPSIEEKNFFDKAFENRWEDTDITKEMQDIIKNDVEQIGLETAADIVDDNLKEANLTETKVNRITAVTDDDGNVLYYKVPSECEELQSLENKDEIKKQIAKIIADNIYKKFNEEMAEKQEPVEVKPVDITPEVVAPKPVFPFRVVDKW